MKTRAPDEACLTYNSGTNSQTIACKSACVDVKSRTQKISNYSTPSRNAMDINAVKKGLLKGALMTTLTVYADFITYGGGVYKRISKDALGGHAVSIVGYDDATQSWIIRNSWGE